jgi:hypothetical protein
VAYVPHSRVGIRLVDPAECPNGHDWRPRRSFRRHYLPCSCADDRGLSTPRPPVRSFVVKGVDLRERHVPGDGFTSKAQALCSNVHFPGAVLYTLRVHECWLGSYVRPRHGLQTMMVLLGREPSAPHRQVMLVGLANGAMRAVLLRAGVGTATMRKFGRSCAVISYRSSNAQTYYAPLRHRVVAFCR